MRSLLVDLVLAMLYWITDFRDDLGRKCWLPAGGKDRRGVILGLPDLFEACYCCVMITAV